MTATWTSSGSGVDLRLELDRDRLLPGRLVAGRLTVTAHEAKDIRGIFVILHGREHWKYETTSTDADGHTRTETHTGHADLPRTPVGLAGEQRLAAGTRAHDFELPVPSLGPASFDAEVAGVEWTVEAKLDIPGSPDVGLEAPVRVLQPVALLRAGVVRVGEFALYDSVDVAGDGVAGRIALDPVPLCAGAPFAGSLVIRPAGGSMKLQEIRAELRVVAKATVSGGLQETIVPWAAVLGGPMELTGELTVEIGGALDDRALPTIELPHGTGHAEFHVILARAWARDPHLVRDVAIATTLEL